MASGGIRLTGQWQQLLKALDPRRFEQALRLEIRRATQKNALIVQREIRKRIQEGQYAANSPLTLAIKAPKSKPLVVTGGLFGAIAQELASDYVAFVGLKFGAKSKDGADLVNVGLALHEGFTLDVTPKMRAAVFARLTKSKSRKAREAREAQLARIPGSRIPGGTVQGPRLETAARSKWVIPSRPFVRQVIEDEAVQRLIRHSWEQAVATALRSL
jgi:hypothetical protein